MLLQMILKQKSKFNSAASDLLIKETYYAPSVHCSYYAAFQLLKVAISSFTGITYDEIDKKVASVNFGEHAYIRREILNIIHNCDNLEYKKIERLIKDLYQFRIDSDYKDIEIRPEMAIKAQANSKSIILYLQEKFHV